MAVTGPTIAGDSTEAIKSGAIGNLLNLVGVDERARHAAAGGQGVAAGDSVAHRL